MFATGKNFSFTAKTDTKGKYGFWGPAASNPYTLVATANGWIPQTKTAGIRPRRTITVDFNLRPTGC